MGMGTPVAYYDGQRLVTLALVRYNCNVFPTLLVD